MAYFTKEYHVIYADDFFYNFTGKQVGNKLTDLFHPYELLEFTEAVEKLQPGENVRLITYLKGLDNKYHLTDVHVFNRQEIVEEQEVYYCQISNLLGMESRFTSLNDNTNKYREFLSMYNDYLFDYDFDADMFTVLSYDSSRSNVFTRGSFEEVKNRIGSNLDDPAVAASFYEFMDKIKDAHEGFNYETTAPSLADTNVMVQYYISTKVIYKHNRGKLAIGIIKFDSPDSNLAYYERPEGKDFFTGLLNKKASQAKVKDIISNESGYHYMIVMDVDNFKSINDNYGHLYGDEVILRIATIINKAVLGRGIVGRFGGDEFFIFTNSINSEMQLRSMLTYLRKTLRQEFVKDFGSEGITCSMGVSLYPKDGKTYDELFNKADKSLYIAKEKGKNRYIIYDPMKHGAVEDESGRINTGLLGVGRATGEVATCLSNILIRLTRLSSKNEFNEELANVIEVLGIDGIRVYRRSESYIYTAVGPYKDISKIEPHVFSGNMIKLFAGRSYMSVSKVNHIEHLEEEICHAHDDSGIGGFYACMNETVTGDTVMIFYDNIDRKCSFSQTEREFMILLSGVIAGIIEDI